MKMYKGKRAKTFNNSWDSLLNQEMNEAYFLKLQQIIDNHYRSKDIYPNKSDIFNALKYTPYEKVKVVIIGQDPYPNEGQANGFAFSVNKGCKIPKSLNNIYRELINDLGHCYYKDGDLKAWADQGVLLLNTILTVEKKKPGSHRGIGWERFTDHIIKQLNKKEDPIIYLLWGKYAISKSKLIDTNKHYILTSSHPSPLSAYRGFIGSKHFSKANQLLNKNNLKEIRW